MLRSRFTTVAALVALVTLALPSVAMAGAPPPFPPPGPIFGLGTDAGGDVLVANVSFGILTPGGAPVAELPGIADVAASDQGWLWAITAGPDATLYRVQDGVATPFADLGAFEAKHNPHPHEVDSNPYSVADLGNGEAVVADAGGNTLLKVNKHGKVKLIAVLPDELVSTANAKAVVEGVLTNLFEFPVSCGDLPDGVPPEAVEVCELPDMIPAEAVATSVAIGPDGDFYVGELKGFPAPTGASKVWRIERNARNADCSLSPLCTVAYDGFTSITNLAFGGDGTLYVAEMEENSWFAVELELFEGLPANLAGGTVNACGTGGCVEATTGILYLSALTADGGGAIWWSGLFGPVAEL